MRTTCEHLRTCVLSLCVGQLSHQAFAQCGGYQVDMLYGIQCQFEATYAVGSGINPHGELCGWYYTCGESGETAIWLGQRGWIDLPGTPGYTGFAPFDINSSRVMAGNTATLQNPNMTIAAIYDFETSTMTSLGTLPGGNRSEGHAINESGIACGLSTNTDTGPHQAFIYKNGQMSALNLPLGPNSNARDIADDGTICGWMGGSTHTSANAFVWKDGQTTDLGVVLEGAIGTDARGISNSGSVCGFAVYTHPKYFYTRRGFLWQDGVGQDLGSLSGYLNVYAFAVNSSNVVVGFMEDFPVQEQPTTAFVWRNGVMMNLNDLIPAELNLHIDIVYSINDAGQIAGKADLMDFSGDVVAVRLTPIPSPTGDLNCDWVVNVDDLLGVINSWGASQASAGNITLHPADFNHDGIVNVEDLLIVLNNWTF